MIIVIILKQHHGLTYTMIYSHSKLTVISRSKADLFGKKKGKCIFYYIQTVKNVKKCKMIMCATLEEIWSEAS